jgi:phosphotransferase system  glucose/maltose/N-acetylglucosamine-specific IIC component
MVDGSDVVESVLFGFFLIYVAWGLAPQDMKVYVQGLAAVIVLIIALLFISGPLIEAANSKKPTEKPKEGG